MRAPLRFALSWAKHAALAAVGMLGVLGLVGAYLGVGIYIGQHHGLVAATIFWLVFMFVGCSAFIGYIEAKFPYK